MTLDNFKKEFLKFREEFIDFLYSSNINLGRLHAKTRENFIEQAKQLFDGCQLKLDQTSVEETSAIQTDECQKQTTVAVNDRIICIKPNDKNKGLNIGKGVHAMTPSESARADEQLNRSPFTQRTNNKVDIENE